jgi:predicted membrane-bound dolichyl-phosphate-mannose-protein mannosyltransferase
MKYCKIICLEYNPGSFVFNMALYMTLEPQCYVIMIITKEFQCLYYNIEYSQVVGGAWMNYFSFMIEETN